MPNATDESSNPIFNDNKLKLGTFCTNTIPNMTFVPEVVPPTWANTLAAAQIADAAGLEAVVPIARWKGYLDEKPDHPSNNVLERLRMGGGDGAGDQAHGGARNVARTDDASVARGEALLHDRRDFRRALRAERGGRVEPARIRYVRHRVGRARPALRLPRGMAAYFAQAMDLPDGIRLRIQEFPHEESDLAAAADSKGRHSDHECRALAGRHALLREEFADRPHQPARKLARGLAAAGGGVQKDGARGIRPGDPAVDQRRRRPGRHAKGSRRLSAPLRGRVPRYGSARQHRGDDQQRKQHSRRLRRCLRRCAGAWPSARGIR